MYVGGHFSTILTYFRNWGGGGCIEGVMMYWGMLVKFRNVSSLWTVPGKFNRVGKWTY